MADRLESILQRKRADVEDEKTRLPLAELKAQCAGLPPCRGFAAALRAAHEAGELAVIAESKRRSPSAGDLADDYDPAKRASIYADAGATCMSVLTDEPFFGAREGDLAAARAACRLPVLRKDFIVEEWQVYETRASGADCMLLIVAALEASLLADLTGLGMELGMDVLVEIHGSGEIEAGKAAGSGLLGINNRNLSTFVADVAVTEKLALQVAGANVTLVSESAIADAASARRVRAAGAHAVLVGEALMRASDPAALVEELRQAG